MILKVLCRTQHNVNVNSNHLFAVLLHKPTQTKNVQRVTTLVCASQSVVHQLQFTGNRPEQGDQSFDRVEKLTCKPLHDDRIVSFPYVFSQSVLSPLENGQTHTYH